MSRVRSQFEQALLVERVAAVKTAATMNFQAELGVAIRKARAQVKLLERSATTDVLRKLDSILHEHGMLLHDNKTLVRYEDDRVTGVIGILDSAGNHTEDELRKVLGKKAKIETTMIARGLNVWLCHF